MRARPVGQQKASSSATRTRARAIGLRRAKKGARAAAVIAARRAAVDDRIGPGEIRESRPRPAITGSRARGFREYIGEGKRGETMGDRDRGGGRRKKWARRRSGRRIGTRMLSLLRLRPIFLTDAGHFSGDFVVAIRTLRFGHFFFISK